MKMDLRTYQDIEVNILSLAINSVHRIFNDKKIRSFFTRLRYPIFLVVIIVIIPNINPKLFLPAISLSLFGELIQLWCFSSIDKNKKLTNKGPYMFTRNPMYIGRFFVLFGFFFLVGDMRVLMVYSFLYYFYVINRIKREEVRLLRIFGESYKNYCMQVNRFWPSFKCFNRKSLLFFRGSLVLQNRGYWNLMAVLSCYLMFGLLAIEKASYG